MVVLNNFLNEIAKSINNESYVYPSHLAVGTEVLSIDVEDTSLAGEIGDGLELTGSRSNNTLEFVALRLSTDVVDTTNGDDLKGFGIFSADTGGTIFIENDIAGILQTTNFDFEITETINIIGQ
jgi:hypothetical protein